jgi:hypothetical protein
MLSAGHISNCYGPSEIHNATLSGWGTYLIFGGPGGLNC